MNLHIGSFFLLFTVLCNVAPSILCAQPGSITIGKLKYSGGGDWYGNVNSLRNLKQFIRENTRVNLSVEEEVVEPGSPQIFQYPMLYLSGHGNIEFSRAEAQNLRRYMLSGGFLLMDDDYGMHKYAVREIRKLFPEYELVDLPFSHPIFRTHFEFSRGLPKIHEHDNKPAQAFGIIHEGRLVLLLTYEADLGDGWEDPQVHNDPPEVRLRALQMGTNILLYALLKP